MKISLVGTRGIPARYGGFETFAEEISPRLVQAGFDVAVQCDNCEIHNHEWSGVKLYYSPVTKSGNPLRYYFDGIRWGLSESDIVLVAGTGGSVFYFLNNFRDKILITNTDGIESGRLKWSLPKRWYVRLSEMLAVRYSNYLIADSQAVYNYLVSKYPSARNKTSIAEYGASINNQADPSVFEKYGVSPGKYYLVVSRIEPENNLLMIVEGFRKAKTGSRLLIVGPVTNTAFCKNLIENFSCEKILFPGGIYNKTELNSLRFACKAYIHGHSVGGTNPSLLEAMGNGNIILSHDNIFNREVTDNSQIYFKNSQGLAESINLVESISSEKKEVFQNKSMDRIKTYYNWNNILIKYSGIFRKFLT